MKNDLERADQDRPATSQRGFIALPTFEKEDNDDNDDFSDDFDSSDERLMEKKDLKKAKLLSQRYSK